VPGSVIAANRLPGSAMIAAVSAQKYRKNDIVSSVVPDFDDTRNSVRAGSIAPVMARTAPGWVLSMTKSSG
jgi:hypothetical protein